MDFAALEREIRGHLAGLLGAGGFDPAADIQAITVNRWPHGYAYQTNTPPIPKGPRGEAPQETGRAPTAGIAIATSNFQALPTARGAVVASRRAVDELAKG